MIVPPPSLADDLRADELELDDLDAEDAARVDPKATAAKALVASTGLARRGRRRRLAMRALLPAGVAAVLLPIWTLLAQHSPSGLFPTPWQVVLALVELASKGLLFKYVVASLFRVTWGFVLACGVGIPLGLLLGWFGVLRNALNPLIQILRPISPIAWIPLAILWFGVSDAAPIFLIFLASVFPIVTATMSGVVHIQPVYLRAARNFGFRGVSLIRTVILPATLPQIITAVRIALGIAWLVVVAAEMIAVNSGLGYLIIDARNAGRRYDLVVAGMFVIGVVGLLLDFVIRRLEHVRELTWAHHDHHA
jgi:NitT/TauT family transport system permease protein